MMSAKKILVTILVVAVLVACIEGQKYGQGKQGKEGGRGGKMEKSRGGKQRYDQGNRGGNANLAESQRGYNVNFGRGDLNNKQRSQTAQSDSQGNYNGPFRGQKKN